jgi:hypothetical protein
MAIHPLLALTFQGCAALLSSFPRRADSFPLRTRLLSGAGEPPQKAQPRFGRRLRQHAKPAPPAHSSAAAFTPDRKLATLYPLSRARGRRE